MPTSGDSLFNIEFSRQKTVMKSSPFSRQWDLSASLRVSGLAKQCVCGGSRNVGAFGLSPPLKLFVAGSPLLAALSIGGAVSYPTVLLHQLKAPESPIKLEFETASWIGAIHGLAGIPSIFMPTLMQWRGRKFAFITACVASIIGWIISYFAQSATVILISESFHGFGSNSIYAVSCLSITEMMAPEHRDTFIQIYYILLCSAMALNGVLAQHLHWKTISLVMNIPMVLAALMALKWPESPYWLAYKRRFSICEKSFIWLRGTDPTSKKELKELINAQKRNDLHQKFLPKISAKHFWETIASRDFYVPLSHIFVLEYVTHGIGFMIVLIYCIEIFSKVSNNSKIALYGGFIVNVIQISGVILSIFLSRYLKKKTLLLASIFSATFFSILASIIYYLQDIGTISKESMIGELCLILYLASLSIGVIPIAYPIASALMPVKHRGIGGALYVTNTCVLHTFALKVAPYLFLYAHLWGTFLIFAVNGIICGCLIWRFVPETKDRTLQDLEDYYGTGEFIEISEKHDECYNLKPKVFNNCDN